jgi:hypothetical protein
MPIVVATEQLRQGDGLSQEFKGSLEKDSETLCHKNRNKTKKAQHTK